MRRRKLDPTRFCVLSLLFALLSGFQPVCASDSAPLAQPQNRYMATAASAGEFGLLREELTRSGATIIREMPGILTFAVSIPPHRRDLARPGAISHAAGIARDGLRALVRPAMKRELLNSDGSRKSYEVKVSRDLCSEVIPDPAFKLPGLMWNVHRVRAPAAWKTTLGSSRVLVGVADTGLDFTHTELASQVVHVKDLTADEDSPICESYFGQSDLDNARIYGGPARTDWHGHGTWIGGNIAAMLDGAGINGIAPEVGLVSLKIAQWCGYAYDSTIIASFLYAADKGIDIVSISFGGYLDRSDPEQDQTYRRYAAAVSYALKKGTVIVAAAGNEHVRIGAGGEVLSHGSMTTPGGYLEDLYGQWAVPGGIPGVVMVSATGNVVEAASPSCPGDSAESFNATCKPESDRHQPFGAGRLNQLAYYSNYGPRIDVAAPGGARKFNLPAADGGGTPGWPVTRDKPFRAWETFSTTSNWGLVVPCYRITAKGFPNPSECYTVMQGTSMATPHVSAALALLAGAYPWLRHNPQLLVFFLKEGARKIDENTTPPLSARDKSRGDLTGLPCSSGYCHLGGKPISYREAFGAGMVNARSFLFPKN
ncbi:MAG TPA: S8 family serine peptidase [Syntrophobacter fumaroxidans]|nr:S8 family serine peptidase [Syntrophobacter fumaroxidans]